MWANAFLTVVSDHLLDCLQPQPNKCVKHWELEVWVSSSSLLSSLCSVWSAERAAEAREVIEQQSISSSEVGGHIYISSILPVGTHAWRAWEPPSPPHRLHPCPTTTKAPLIKGQLQCTFHPSKRRESFLWKEAQFKNSLLSETDCFLSVSFSHFNTMLWFRLLQELVS